LVSLLSGKYDFTKGGKRIDPRVIIGNAKQAYHLNQIKAKLKNTSESWITATLFVMNVINFANILNLTF